MSCPTSASLAESNCSSLLQINYSSSQETNSLLALSSQATLHGEFYFQDGMEKFLVEDKLFRIHVQFLTRESEKLSFIGSRQRDPIHQAIFLPGVTIPEFESLLKHFYYGMRENYKPALDESIALLSISCREEFGMERIRTCAIQSIDRVGGIADPVQRIALGAKYGVQEWIDSAHAALHQRKESITLSEARLLGLEMYLSIVDAREERLQKLLDKANKVQEPPPPTTSDVVTDPFAGLKGKALEDAKKKAKSDEKLKMNKEVDTTHEAIQPCLSQMEVESGLSGPNRELEGEMQALGGIDSKVAQKQMELFSHVKPANEAKGWGLTGWVSPQSHDGNNDFVPLIPPMNEKKEDAQVTTDSQDPSVSLDKASDTTQRSLNLNPKPNPFAGLRGKALKDAKKRAVLERMRQLETPEKADQKENGNTLGNHQAHENMIGCTCDICLRDRGNM